MSNTASMAAGGGGGELEKKVDYNAHSETLKVDPRQVFGLVQKCTLNSHIVNYCDKFFPP